MISLLMFDNVQLCSTRLPQVIVSTPAKNYTIADQKQLMLDMGNTGGVSNLCLSVE